MVVWSTGTILIALGVVYGEHNVYCVRLRGVIWQQWPNGITVFWFNVLEHHNFIEVYEEMSRQASLYGFMWT